MSTEKKRKLSQHGISEVLYHHVKCLYLRNEISYNLERKQCENANNGEKNYFNELMQNGKNNR